MEPDISSKEAPPSSVGGQSVGRPQQAPSDDPILSIQELGYEDFMILGLTGQGKTTTTDKLLIANPTGVDYRALYERDPTKLPTVDTSSQEAIMQDLHMWLIPNDQFSLERISTRLKNLAFYRTLEHPHLEVNMARESEMNVHQRTLKCELFSNETTKVRVLDVPGFFGAMTAEQVQAAMSDGFSPRSTSLVLDTHSTHLSTMRTILNIQTVMKMRFRRILYFLPCRGPLSIISAALQQELQLLVHYFGKSIFETMVLVATLDQVTYELLPNGVDVKFPQQKLDASKETFQEALRSFFPIDTPNPPIIFISLREPCESILDKVQQTEVALDGLQLELTSSICARCNVTIGSREGERVAVIKSPDWSRRVMQDADWDQGMPYEHSHCHPHMVPKYTRGQKIAEGIAYTLRAVAHREFEPWPDLSAEKCIQCGLPPGTEGCTKVGTMRDNVRIDHTSKVDEYSHRQLVQSRHKTSSASSLRSDSEPMDVQASCSEGENSLSGSGRQASLVDESEIQKQQETIGIEPNCSIVGGAALGESYQEIVSNSSEGIEKTVVERDSEGVEQREVTVDIEPGHSPQASLETGT